MGSDAEGHVEPVVYVHRNVHGPQNALGGATQLGGWGVFHSDLDRRRATRGSGTTTVHDIAAREQFRGRNGNQAVIRRHTE